MNRPIVKQSQEFFAVDCDVITNVIVFDFAQDCDVITAVIVFDLAQNCNVITTVVVFFSAQDHRCHCHFCGQKKRLLSSFSHTGEDIWWVSPAPHTFPFKIVCLHVVLARGWYLLICPVFAVSTDSYLFIYAYLSPVVFPTSTLWGALDVHNCTLTSAFYWVIQWSQFARVNALCNLSRKKLWKFVAAASGPISE